MTDDNTVSFTVSDIPPSTDAHISDDLTCEVCGTPLSYSGRGRKPKFCDEHRSSKSGVRTSGRRSGKDVDAAMAALSGGHTVLQFGLSLVSLEAGSAFELSRVDLDNRNRSILESDPALAKRLASMASKGGAGALLISHFIAVGPAAAIAYSQLRTASQAKAQQRRAESEAINTDGIDF